MKIIISCSPQAAATVKCYFAICISDNKPFDPFHRPRKQQGQGGGLARPGWLLESDFIFLGIKAWIVLLFSLKNFTLKELNDIVSVTHSHWLLRCNLTFTAPNVVLKWSEGDGQADRLTEHVMLLCVVVKRARKSCKQQTTNSKQLFPRASPCWFNLLSSATFVYKCSD